MKVIFTFDCEDVISVKSDQYLSDIAKILEEFEARGVFYFTYITAKTMRQRSRQLFTSMIQTGHEIGYHSYDHSLSTTPKEEVLGLRKLQELVGKPVRVYNAPCFVKRPEIIGALGTMGVRYIKPMIYLFEYGYRHRFNYLLHGGCNMVIFGAHPCALSNDRCWGKETPKYNQRRAKENLQRLKSLLKYIKSQGVEITTFSGLSRAELQHLDVLKKASRFGLKALYHYALYRLATLQYLSSLSGRTKHAK